MKINRYSWAKYQNQKGKKKQKRLTRGAFGVGIKTWGDPALRLTFSEIEGRAATGVDGKVFAPEPEPTGSAI